MNRMYKNTALDLCFLQLAKTCAKSKEKQVLLFSSQFGNVEVTFKPVKTSNKKFSAIYVDEINKDFNARRI